MSKLVICEKPSVAQSIGKVLGASKRCDGYLEGGGYIVSWCVGHLVELAQPEAYGETYAKWRLEDLPILPEKWQYRVSPSTKKQFQVLKGLMGREDVTSIVEATDAGREGELIFRLVYHQCKCKKPFERLWISSMEDAAIREGFASLRPGTEYDALYEAALCRERADWIVGINATRLFSCKYGPTLNVGRVMTPTLAMVCGREAAISGFQSEPFYTVQLVPEGFAANGERMKEKAEAEKIAARYQAQADAEAADLDAKNKKAAAEREERLAGTAQMEARKAALAAKQEMVEKAYDLALQKLCSLPEEKYTAVLAELPADRLPLAYRLLPKELAAEAFVEMDPEEQEQLIQTFSDTELKEVLDELYVDDTVDLIEEMPASVVKRILRHTDPETRRSVNEILKYPEDSAGSIMTTEFVDLKANMTLEDALKRIRRTGPDKETINICYVTDPSRHLLGLVSIRTLLLADDEDVIEDIMETNVVSASTLDDREAVAQALRRLHESGEYPERLRG